MRGGGIFAASYQLADGTAGSLEIEAASSFDAVGAMLERFGLRLVRLSVKPVERNETVQTPAPDAS